MLKSALYCPVVITEVNWATKHLPEFQQATAGERENGLFEPFIYIKPIILTRQARTNIVKAQKKDRFLSGDGAEEANKKNEKNKRRIVNQPKL